MAMTSVSICAITPSHGDVNLSVWVWLIQGRFMRWSSEKIKIVSNVVHCRTRIAHFTIPQKGLYDLNPGPGSLSLSFGLGLAIYAAMAVIILFSNVVFGAKAQWRVTVP